MLLLMAASTFGLGRRYYSYLRHLCTINWYLTRIWVNAQRDGHPAKYRWRPLFKTQYPLKLAGVPQANETISAASRPKFTILWRYVEEILLMFNNFFPIVDTCLSCKDIAWQSCAMVTRWRIFRDFLRPAFPASPVQHVSDLHSKFTLRPHHVWKYGRHPICGRWD